MINQKHKDRLFTFIFGREENKRWTLALYNAVNHTHYTDPDEIELNTISDTLYMGMKNDVSFLMQFYVNLYAHQSSFNPNMPLRELMYLGRLYDKYIHQRNLNIYSSHQLELPVPKLVVFYNGRTDEPDEMFLELKDSFPEGIDPEVSDVQVRVRMLNINYGRNLELLDSCRPLMEYSWLVDRIRSYRDAGKEIETAVDTALDDMSEDFEIRAFLVENRAEVKSMCITEYNEEETMKLFREEWREEGRAEGREEGREEGRAEGREEGRADRDMEKIGEMLDNGKDPKAIAEFCNYPLELVQHVLASRAEGRSAGGAGV